MASRPPAERFDVVDDLDAVERLLADLDAERRAAKQAKRAKKLGLDPEAASAKTATKMEVPPPSVAQNEYNPYASRFAEEQQLAREAAAEPVAPLRPRPTVLAPIEHRTPSQMPPATADAPLLVGVSRVAAEEVDDMRHIVAGQLKALKKASKPKKAKRSKRTAGDAVEEMAADGHIHAVLHAHNVIPAAGCLVPTSRLDHTSVLLRGCVVVTFGGLALTSQSTTGRPVPTSECHEFQLATHCWEPVIPSRGDAPSPRSLQVAAAVDLDHFDVPRYMIVHGGRAANGDALGDLHLFDSVAQSWVAIAPQGARSPVARWGHAAVGIRQKVYIFAGRYVKQAGADATSQQAARIYLANDVWALDVKKQKWLRVLGNFTPSGGDTAGAAPSAEKPDEGGDDAGPTTMHGPTKRQRHAICASADGASLFVHGGIDAAGSALNDLWKFDLATKVWVEIARPGLGVPRARHTMVYLNDRIVLVAGVAATTGADLSRATTIVSLGPGDEAWRQHALVGDVVAPTRAGATAVLALGSLLLLGGSSPTAEVQLRTPMTSIDLVSNWRGLDSIPVGAYTRAALAESCGVGQGAPYDCVLAFVDGSGLGCHRSFLALRAPAFEAAVIKCESSAATAALYPGQPLLPGARAYAVDGTRRTAGLAHRLSKDAASAFLAYLYTGAADDEQSDIVAALRSIATAYDVTHLDAVLDTLEAKGDEPIAARRALARVAGEDELRSTVESMVGDLMSSDAEVAVGHDARVAVSVDAHQLLLAAGSPVLRKLLCSVSQQWMVRFGSVTPGITTAGQQNNNSPARGGAHWSDDRLHCVDRATGIEVSLKRTSGTADQEDPPRVCIRFLSMSDEVPAPSRSSAATLIRLPADTASLRVAMSFIYRGTAAGLTADNAVDVLLVAKGLGLPLLAAAAERVLVQDLADGSQDPSLLSASSVCALLQLGVQYAAPHVISRASVAAAARYNDVSSDEHFAQLPAAVRHSIEVMASQWGNALRLTSE